ncbi:hypothetical protein PMAYCL1PPCAC_19364, partial [Pristionchus mayeri]
HFALLFARATEDAVGDGSSKEAKHQQNSDDDQEDNAAHRENEWLDKRVVLIIVNLLDDLPVLVGQSIGSEDVQE